MTQPRRIQLSRKKGFNLQEYSLALNGLPAVKVTRPGKWGNPFPVDHEGTAMHCLSLGLNGEDRTDRATAAVDLFRRCVEGGCVNELVAAFLPPFGSAPLIRHIQRDLRGKNLACFCRLDQPCHASVLLEIANRPVCEEVA